MFPNKVLIIWLVYTTVHTVAACMCMSAWIDCEPFVEKDCVSHGLTRVFISYWQICTDIF